MNHGVSVEKRSTVKTALKAADSGIPFYIGAAPLQAAVSPAKVGVPILCESFEDAQEKLGYSDDWTSYPLCEAMDVHFRLYGMAPAIFCNLLDPSSMQESMAASDVPVKDGRALLPGDAIHDASLVVKAQGGTGEPYTEGEDYSAYYGEDGQLVVELLDSGKAGAAAQLNIAYSKATPSSVTADDVAEHLSAVDLCMVTVGWIPDLICAPGYDGDAALAAVMALKTTVSGAFSAKAVIEIEDADTAAEAIAAKDTLGLTDDTQILCWPRVLKDGKIYHRSVHLCALMARVDQGNGSCPYESPSNKLMEADGMALADGSEVTLTVDEANVLNDAGIVTGLHAFDHWVAWGNRTAGFPKNDNPEDTIIPVSRMFAWVGNTIVRMVWDNVDRPITRRLLDDIIDRTNIWLNGLFGEGKIYGARVEAPAAENTSESLSQGRVRFHIVMTPPSPAEQIEWVLTYDKSIIASALAE